jgi:anti-sigma regulatory factor (Ser/Thr protein kinase)
MMTRWESINGHRFEQSLPATPSSVGVLRDLTAFHLDKWGLSGHGIDVLLIVSELATNAVTAGGGGFVELRVWGTGDSVVIEVEDSSPVLPTPRVAEDDDTSGRGLAIVEILAEEWGVRESAAGGKVVWARYGRLKEAM